MLGSGRGEGRGDDHPTPGHPGELSQAVEPLVGMDVLVHVHADRIVDRAVAKQMVAVEGENRERKIAGARRLYAAVLAKALEYGGADVGVIVYKSTKDWIKKHCFVPDWLKILHWGDLTGTNTLQNVRALFVIGRPLAAAEDVTRQAEALFGTYIRQREYRVRRKQGRTRVTIASKSTCGGTPSRWRSG